MKDIKFIVAVICLLAMVSTGCQWKYSFREGFVMSAIPTIIAHRGASFDAPENTMAAFELAWRQGCDGIELDIHLTADKQIVVSHDGNTKRVGDRELDIASSSYEQLSQCDVGAFKAAEFEGERIPLLKDVLAAMPDETKVLIEIKCGAEVAGLLRDVIAESQVKDEQIILICFNEAVLAACHDAMPQLCCLFLAGVKEPTLERADELIELCQRNGFDGVDLCFENGITAEFIEAFHEEQLLVYTWTVNDPEIAKRQGQAMVDGITSDRAAYLAEQWN